MGVLPAAWTGPLIQASGSLVTVKTSYEKAKNVIQARAVFDTKIIADDNLYKITVFKFLC